jgi:hypothetical protein
VATAAKRKLSGSTDGKAIKITQTATAGDLIHTAVAGTTAGTFDEIWLWANNIHTADVIVTVEFGTHTAADGNIIVTVPFKSGLVPLLPGLILQNEMDINIFAGSANVILITGFVNTITD